MTIVIAGASSGIGLALAERLERNHRVLKLSRQVDCDLADWHSVTSFAWAFGERHPDNPIDALVITAGHQATLGRIEDSDPAAWRAAVHANLGVVFNTVRAFYPLLKRSRERRPKVIALGGGGASQGRPYFSSYACAKTAVVRFMETLAMEEPGWDVNTVAPGAINTRMLDAVLAAPELVGRVEHAKALTQRASGGQSMDKALDCIEWFLSRESDGVSGRFIAAQWDKWRDTDWKAWPDLGKLRRTV